MGPGGASWFAESSEDKDAHSYVKKIGEAIGLRGSANVQFRRSKDGLRLLEINPRFSSLVAARAICGFTDLEWSIKVALGMEIYQQDRVYKHIRFRRYAHELVDFGEGYLGVANWSPRERGTHGH